MKILVTAGPTREHFDSVRFISNPSSGKMGYAIARAAAARGHRVTLVAGPVDLPDPEGVTTIHVVSAAQMAAACKRIYTRSDTVIMTAAVCDYRPAEPSKRKQAKDPAGRTVFLEPTEDIIAGLSAHKKPGQISIGFALEDHDAKRKARAKLERKNLDAIVLNGPANIGSDRASVQVLRRGKRWLTWAKATKHDVADRIVRLAEQLALAP